ncbi:MAG TPA: radical SAM protein, partial [Acidobacteriaceae bacterium]
MAKFALVNPNWDFAGSTYFGCRDPHTPLELLFAAQKIRAKGNEAVVIDAQTADCTLAETREQVARFDPDFLVIPSTPSYLFWRCPPPEVRIPREWFAGIGGRATKVLIGPHSSATPRSAMHKTGADVVVKGESEDALAALASEPWEMIDGVCFRNQTGREHYSTAQAVVDMSTLPALEYADYEVEKHWHRHHVFNQGSGRGAEVEFARGCPWNCSFCNKQLFRNKFRERDVDAVLLEIDRLIARGVDYIYFIDEIFGVGKNVLRLLEGISQRKVSIGFQ